MILQTERLKQDIEFYQFVNHTMNTTGPNIVEDYD